MLTDQQTTELKSLLFDDAVQKLKDLPQDIIQIIQVENPIPTVDKFVKTIQKYVIRNILAIKKIETIEESDEDTIEIIQKTVCDILKKHIRTFFGEDLPKRIVQYHAQGCTTTEAVNTVINDFPTMQRLAKDDAIGIKELRRLLIQRLAYLKPGHPRWPEQKYGDLWRESREKMINEAVNLPLTTTGEQVSVLVENIKRMQSTLEKDDISPREIHLITNSITRTIQTLNRITMSENSNEYEQENQNIQLS